MKPCHEDMCAFARVGTDMAYAEIQTHRSEIFSSLVKMCMGQSGIQAFLQSYRPLLVIAWIVTLNIGFKFLLFLFGEYVNGSNSIFIESLRF